MEVKKIKGGVEGSPKFHCRLSGPGYVAMFLFLKLFFLFTEILCQYYLTRNLQQIFLKNLSLRNCKFYFSYFLCNTIQWDHFSGIWGMQLTLGKVSF